MTTNSKFFDSIRIRPKKEAEKKSSGPCCQWDGCDKPGTHRAPVGREREGEYLRFCVDHVREYNKNFNYFSGLNDSDISKFQKDAITGNRPTWSTTSNPTGSTRTSPDMAKRRSGSAAYQNRMRDPFGFVKDAKNNTGTAKAVQRKPRTLEVKALGTLGLDANSTSDMIKSRYKELVKQHHPDANGGDRGSEERFREVIQAYQLLKTAGFC
ncbi:J domain-containing protein [Brucella pseudogrignonensis]|uniref:Curved DNA-binding protein CbpA n=1 Tax=Brucella pseudogrignonensis TaxID=419475 RepID=A0ABU1M9Z6_9HYPH|nr:J domain-containing protein [Brucella pseudogrignonensis]MDR6432857.1 curved DNA-binding protein CbpA [Brucella pseudogrignonensis]